MESYVPLASPEINKVLRRIVSPALREAGFTKVQARTAWRWLDHTIWVFKIRAVGADFSAVTNWPSMSLAVEMGAYYGVVPDDARVKRDESGRMYPQEYQCHLRQSLCSSLDQERLKIQSTVPN